MPYRLVFVISAAFALSACGNTGSQQPKAKAPASTPSAAVTAASTPSSNTKRFSNTRLGFRIDYPQDMASSTTFDSRYLANDNWKTYAPADSSGSPVLMLTLPGSNDVTAGELRIGISHNDKAVAQCIVPPTNTGNNSTGKVTINGTTFTRFHAADAGMSHYLKVHSYRVVHHGECWAIDLLVTGTNPKVYDPPRTPPFSNREAFKQLHEALRGFRFTR